MRTYRRVWIPGGIYFFTVNLADRSSTLLLDHIGSLRKSFRQVREAHPFKIDAMVVMPDHLHCIWQLPEDDDRFAMRWRLIKAQFSMAVAAGEPISRSRSRKGERGIWQRRYWEHVVRDEDDWRRHVEYIHYNPVKHGYVQSSGEWLHSSFRRFVQRELYPMDWAAPRSIAEMDIG